MEMNNWRATQRRSHGATQGHAPRGERVPGKVFPAARMERVRVRDVSRCDCGPEHRVGGNPFDSRSGECQVHGNQLARGHVVEVNTGIESPTWIAVTDSLPLMEARRIHSVIERGWTAERAELFRKLDERRAAHYGTNPPAKTRYE